MSNPVKDFYKEYRVLCPIDESTGDFPMNISVSGIETYCDNDVYIKCSHGGQIFYKGRNRLVFYCPSKIRCKNLVKKIEELGIDHEPHYSDVEGWVVFKKQDIQALEDVFEISKHGAGRSPFSKKNLPKSDYKIPDTDLAKYKSLTECSEDMRIKMMQSVRRINNAFLAAHFKNYSKDMRVKGMKAKEYIHSNGLWDKYIEYLEKELVLSIS